jgi:hypothetical protein
MLLKVAVQTIWLPHSCRRRSARSKIRAQSVAACRRRVLDQSVRSIPAGPGSSPLPNLGLKGIRISRAFMLISRRRRPSLSAISSAGYRSAMCRSLATSPSVQGLYRTICAPRRASSNLTRFGGRVSGGTGDCMLFAVRQEKDRRDGACRSKVILDLSGEKPACTQHAHRRGSGKRRSKCFWTF